MATTKNSAKALPGKPPAAATVATQVRGESVSKAAARSKPAPKSVPQKTAVKPVRPPAKKSAGISMEQRKHYIEMAAYYIAERRGFAPGNPLEDWMQAEAEIDRLLAEGHVGG
jgi:hypothetical protein